ncbi:MAG TPA: RNA 2',3'-cyclic phosphodiesterase [Burkholderiaceae bacterium]|nr:RNA 2',3'-cyclic phosphodiesterase [Burkholderiaceae bacterium]
MRLFLAIEPDDAARAALAALAERVAAATGARAVPAANLHLTLVFLGEVDPARVDALRDATAGVAARHPAFDLVFDVPGAFAGARVAWLAPSAPPPGLLALQAALARACVGAGVTIDARRYAPHVTLARKLPAAAARGADRMPAPGTAVGWRAGDVALMRSSPAPGGVVYDAIARAPLAG